MKSLHLIFTQRPVDAFLRAFEYRHSGMGGTPVCKCSANRCNGHDRHHGHEDTPAKMEVCAK